MFDPEPVGARWDVFGRGCPGCEEPIEPESFPYSDGVRCPMCGGRRRDRLGGELGRHVLVVHGRGSVSPFSPLQAWVIVVSAAVTAIGTLARVYFDWRRDRKSPLQR